MIQNLLPPQRNLHLRRLHPGRHPLQLGPRCPSQDHHSQTLRRHRRTFPLHRLQMGLCQRRHQAPLSHPRMGYVPFPTIPLSTTIHQLTSKQWSHSFSPAISSASLSTYIRRSARSFYTNIHRYPCPRSHSEQ